MDFRELGKTGLRASRIGMGTWRSFDVDPADVPAFETRQQIADEAIAAGVNFFDSSPMYGSAEAVPGKTLHARRRSVIVATKVWSQAISEGRKQIQRAWSFFDGYVDVYQVHNLVGWPEYLPVLRSFRDEGRIAAIGITHWQHSAFAEMSRILEKEDIDTVQLPYNALDPGAEAELLPLAAERNIGVIVMMPLGSGELVLNAPSVKALRSFENFGVQTWA